MAAANMYISDSEIVFLIFTLFVLLPSIFNILSLKIYHLNAVQQITSLVYDLCDGVIQATKSQAIRGAQKIRDAFASGSSYIRGVDFGSPVRTLWTSITDRGSFVKNKWTHITDDSQISNSNDADVQVVEQGAEQSIGEENTRISVASTRSLRMITTGLPHTQSAVRSCPSRVKVSTKNWFGEHMERQRAIHGDLAEYEQRGRPKSYFNPLSRRP